MKLNKLLPLSMGVVLSTFALPSVQACENNANYDSEQSVIILQNANQKGGDTESYPFAIAGCKKKASQNKEGNKGAATPAAKASTDHHTPKNNTQGG